MSTPLRRNRPQGFSTRAIHLGYDPATAQGALTPPIYMTSTFAFETAEAGSEMFKGERPGYIYGRTRNPTQTILEERMASLENGEAAMTTGSGMAAISATMTTLLSSGDEAVIDHTVYGNTFAYFTQALPRFGITVRLADFTDPESLRDVVNEKTKIIFFETPANPNLRVIDIANPMMPREVGYALPVPQGIARTYPVFKDGLMYWADNRTGLHVAKYTGPYANEIPTKDVYEGNATSPHR